ncbi:MAG: DNA starvation/stationary phase protection protein [Candidatus Leucobacter sulfamidivorax]|nr:DNA starvation/stationary phase protection protein [Candidatus Leucobacter sulfamidivorax]
MVTKNKSIVVSKVDLDRAAGIERYLTPVVRDLVALAVNGKQAHWHVRGANFIGVHEFLDDLVDHAQEGADEVAERVVALGLPVDARLASVAEQSSLPGLSAGFQQSEDTIREVIANLDAAITTVYAAIDGLGDIDLPSQDIVIGLARQLDKDRWFLNSHIAA